MLRTFFDNLIDDALRGIVGGVFLWSGEFFLEDLLEVFGGIRVFCAYLGGKALGCLLGAGGMGGEFGLEQIPGEANVFRNNTFLLLHLL